MTTIIYKNKESKLKEISFQADLNICKSELDERALLAALENEYPDIIHTYPTVTIIQDCPRGSKGTKIKSNIELMNYYGINSLTYTIENHTHRITT